MLKHFAHAAKDMIGAAEAQASADGDPARLAALQDLHADLTRLAVKHAVALDMNSTELRGLVSTNAGGSPKD